MDDVEFIVDEYGDMLYRICLIRLANEADAEDAVQDTYLRYMKKHPKFDSEEHRKAWLIRVAINRCRDICRCNRAHAAEDIDTITGIYADEGSDGGEVIRTLLLLPEKYSEVMILHFAEGQDYKTIAGIIGRSESAVKMRVKKGRELFMKIYKKE
ncbi:MAG: sigma-70 family RNA polymerase sigma factor [Clostridia bacterium]|nr:sigma-70 family RNA polymerase sigma factor [Clostridia bacterium]